MIESLIIIIVIVTDIIMFAIRYSRYPGLRASRVRAFGTQERSNRRVPPVLKSIYFPRHREQRVVKSAYLGLSRGALKAGYSLYFNVDTHKHPQEEGGGGVCARRQALSGTVVFGFSHRECCT